MGFQEYKKNLLNGLSKVYKKCDIYGKSLTLTFEGEDTHYTYIGATITFMILIFMVIYAAFQLDTMFKRERTTVNLKSAYVDLTREYDDMHLHDFGFDFALQLSLFGEPVYDETYFRFEVQNIISWWAEDTDGITKRFKESIDLKMGPCTNYTAPAEEIARLGIDDTFYCPSYKNYSIGGTFTAPHYRYLYIKLLKCTNYTEKSDCKSPEEIDAFMDNTQLSLFYNNFYFDSDDYNDPVKTLIDDKIWFSVMPKIRKDADMFVRKNKMSLQDSFVQITGEENDMFISVSGQRETIDDYEEGDDKLVRVYFRVDPIVDSHERQVYSSGDLLAQVGGYFSFLQVIGGVMVFMFSERLLISSLAAKLYQVYDEKNDDITKYDDQDGDEDMALNQSMNKSMSRSINRNTSKVHNMPPDDEESNFFRTNPVRNLIKSTMYCKNRSSDIVKKLKQNKALNDVDRQKIKNLIVARKRLNYNTWDVFEYMICCVMCRQRGNRRKWKNHLLFSEAEEKIHQQLDVVNILRWIEQLKLLSKGLLNHKQKFWLKFQKEHLLEINENSEEERKKKKQPPKNEINDLIVGLHQRDKKSIDKVKKMIKYLQHGNRTDFDLKIIQGLFEEYVSDSDDEDRAERAMNTEEEHAEFYSLQYAMQDPNDSAGGGRRKRRGPNGLVLDGLKQLYNQDDGIVSIGSSAAVSNNWPTYKSAGLNKSKPHSKLNKSKTIKKQSTGFLSMNDKRSKRRKNQHSRVLNIEEEGSEHDDTDEMENYPRLANEDGSVLDPDNEDFLANVESKLKDSKTKGDSNTVGKSSSEKVKLESEEEKNMDDVVRGSSNSPSNKILEDDFNSKSLSGDGGERRGSRTHANHSYKDGDTRGKDINFV